jgi:hypothetical protein
VAVALGRFSFLVAVLFRILLVILDEAPMAEKMLHVGGVDLIPPHAVTLCPDP